MKKIAFRISNDFSTHFISEFIQQKLKLSQIEVVFFKTTDSISTENFQGFVLLTNPQDTSLFESDALRFHQESKPIVVFTESSKCVARFLRLHNPVIAIQENDLENMQLNKLGVDTEICPVDDFITDRYTKILSTTIKLSDSQMNPSIEKGLTSLCKELVEMC